MFVIGRNVEIKVEEGKLTIVCQIEDVVPSVSWSGDKKYLATTNGATRIPNTDLHLYGRS
ncbi:unnamed protein product [marine sediment metagenome]|uniref:Uncharacterized protein n=1 Tax=marine sediment metagenome TaxID=412755 RepID=X1PKX5_9ZZZZ